MSLLGAESLAEYPMLAGPGVKGAAVRAMIPWAANLAADLRDGSKTKERRHQMMQGLVSFYRIVEGHSFFLSEAAVAELDVALHRLLSNYCYLADLHMRAGRIRYNVVYKHHYSAHFVDLARSINPGKISTYCEESFCSQGARIYCHGAYGRETQHAVLRKYLVALQMKLALPILAV